MRSLNAKTINPTRLPDQGRASLARRCALAVATLAALSATLTGCRRLAATPSADGGTPSPFTDFRGQAPGKVHRIQLKDLPPPNQSPRVYNDADVIERPRNAWPRVPAGFQVQLYAEGLTNPRLLRTAPNGDVFVAESRKGALRVFRGLDQAGRAVQTEIFARGLRLPFGIAFYPPSGEPRWLYVANTDSVQRFAYSSGDLRARGEPETVVDTLPGGGRLRGGGHWTRDIAFSLDGKKMYVSVGSRSNNDETDDNPAEYHRANILVFNADGSDQEVYAWGIRNPVGIAVHPRTGDLWASVNERDELGENLVPDYITRVKEGGFYGWPWFYMGGHYDPLHVGKHPELRDQVLTPDVLIQPHNASLQMTFYEPPSASSRPRGDAEFPEEYRGDIFAAQHGSWNRASRTGYEVIRVPLHGKGRPTGEYQDFLTGFVDDGGRVWGRPVGVTVASDGALLVSDDGGNCIWRVSYTRG